MEASGARGGVGRASYEAVRRHIDEGKKATEAFKLVAEQTGRSAATVQTAYYRVARSLPGGGGVQVRPRKSSMSKRAGGSARKRASGAASGALAGARRGGRSGAGASSASVATLARQLSTAIQALVAHVARLEEELASARQDSKRLAEIERTLRR